jgi:hypothetical protein
MGDDELGGVIRGLLRHRQNSWRLYNGKSIHLLSDHGDRPNAYADNVYIYATQANACDALGNYSIHLIP